MITEKEMKQILWGIEGQSPELREVRKIEGAECFEITSRHKRETTASFRFSNRIEEWVLAKDADGSIYPLIKVSEIKRA